MKAKVRWVVGYVETDNVYGGPEEGGWFYSAGRPLEGRDACVKTFFRVETANAYWQHLNDRIPCRDRFGGIGVGGCGDDDGMFVGGSYGNGISVVVQRSHPKSRVGLRSWPSVTPRYE